MVFIKNSISIADTSNMKRLTIFLLVFTVITTFSGAQSSGTDNFRQEGVASWYGSDFDGKPTASGEIFDSGGFTAAHPTLPFGTVLVVTNKQNDKRVTIRINDRGPFVAARIIDLSRAAAEVLDMLTTGTAPVIIERAQNTILGPGGEPVVVRVAEAAPEPPPPAASAQPVAPVPEPVYTAPVQPTPPPVESQPQPAPVYTPPPVYTPAPPPQAQPAPIYTPPAQPAYTPPPVYTPAPPPVYAPPPAYTAPPPAYSPPAQPSMPPAVVRGAMPPAGSVKLYRLQVGAYAVPRNAVDAFDRLKSAGLNPAYERNGELYRVVLPGLRANEIQPITQLLGNLGYREALIREE